jgi:hypothetical protein
MEQIYYIFGIIFVIVIVIIYIIAITNINMRENLSIGTINQLHANDSQNRYLTYEPVPYNNSMYSPLTFWNMSTRIPYSSPYYIGIHNYLDDRIIY